MPALAATAPTTTSIARKSVANGTINNPAAITAKAGAISQRVNSGLISGENTSACTAIITPEHSVNIAAICPAVRPSSCLPRSASPTSNTATPADTTKPKARSHRTTRGAGTTVASARATKAADPGRTVTATASAAISARPPVATSGSARAPAAPPNPRVSATPRVGPSRNPEIPASETYVNRRPRSALVTETSVTAARATGVTAAANSPLSARST